MSVNGALVVNKPKGYTSHDVVNRVRHITGERSVGHLGTLDPMATGVLPLLLGKLTRLAQFYQNAAKEYSGTIRFGSSTDTYDADGEQQGEALPVNFSLDELRRAAEKYQGAIQMIPPPFSAKKLQGVPAYKLARNKQPVELLPVDVHIHQFEMVSLDGTDATFRSEVSSGTYIRSLAHELGKDLGCGAHLFQLERTRAGTFTLEKAVSIEELEAAAKAGTLHKIFIQPHELLPEFPAVVATDEMETRIRHGNAVNLPVFVPAQLVRVFSPRGELLAIANKLAGTLYQPKIVLAE